MKTNRITEEEMRKLIQETAVMLGGQSQLSSKTGLSRQFICDVLKGRRGVGPTLAAAMGYREIVVFERVQQ